MRSLDMHWLPDLEHSCSPLQRGSAWGTGSLTWVPLQFPGVSWVQTGYLLCLPINSTLHQLSAVFSLLFHLAAQAVYHLP